VTDFNDAQNNNQQTMISKHSHIDDLRALELSEKLYEGKMDEIITCEACRQKVAQVLEMTLPDDAEGQWDWAKKMINMMELAAFFCRKETSRLLKEGNGIMTDQSKKYLSRIFDARKIIGEEGNLIIDESRMTPDEMPVIVVEEL
jgi:hypothetical protein